MIQKSMMQLTRYKSIFNSFKPYTSNTRNFGQIELVENERAYERAGGRTIERTIKLTNEHNPRIICYTLHHRLRDGGWNQFHNQTRTDDETDGSEDISVDDKQTTPFQQCQLTDWCSQS